MPIFLYWKRIILKSAWIIALVVVLALSCETAYILTKAPEYESSTTILLNPAVPSSLVPYVQTQVAANLADSYTELILTRSFADSVAKELTFPIAVEDMNRAITTQLEPNTLFYKISVRMSSPAQAQQLLNAVLKVFLSANTRQPSTADDDQSEMRARLRQTLKVLDAQILIYQGQLSSLTSQTASDEINNKIFQVQSQLDSVQRSQIDTVLALGQLGSDTVSANSALVIDQPLAGHLVPSRLLENLVFAFLGSLALGVGIAFGRDYLDYTIHSPQDLEELIGVAPLATVGLIGGSSSGHGDGKRGKKDRRIEPAEARAGSNLIALEQPRAAEAESFRQLRTNIEFSGAARQVKTLVVTSVGPGEGKSFISSNLAVVMAQNGKRVLLVDADLRRPSLHKVFGLPNSAGLTTLIVAPAQNASNVIHSVENAKNLFVMTSGPLPPNPSELLNSPRARQLMNFLANHFDIVIYDSPPAGAVTDAVILGTRVDAVMLVIGAGQVRKDAIIRMILSLQKVGVTNVLSLLNRVKDRDMRDYTYHYYGKYYSADIPTEKEVAKRSNGHTPHDNAETSRPLDLEPIGSVAPENRSRS